MKPSTILALCGALALTFLAAAPAAAGSLNPKDVPAKAQIVGHVDLDALRSSQLARTFATELADARKELGNELKSEGIPLEVDDIFNASSITFWGEGDDAERGALIVSGINGRKFSKAIKKLPNVKALGKGMYKIDDTFVGIKSKKMVVADDKESVLDTLEVLAGSGKSVAQTKNAARLKTSSGVFILAAFDEAIAKKIKKEASSAIFNNITLKRGTVTVGEKNRNLVAKAVIETVDVKGANQLHKLAAGGISFFSVASDNADLGKLLNGIDIKSSGNTVTFTIKLPIAELKNIAKALN